MLQRFTTSLEKFSLPSKIHYETELPKSDLLNRPWVPLRMETLASS